MSTPTLEEIQALAEQLPLEEQKRLAEHLLEHIALTEWGDHALDPVIQDWGNHPLDSVIQQVLEEEAMERGVPLQQVIAEWRRSMTPLPPPDPETMERARERMRQHAGAGFVDADAPEIDGIDAELAQEYGRGLAIV